PWYYLIRSGALSGRAPELRKYFGHQMLRPPKSWELILPYEGWMCEGDEEKKEIGGMKSSVDKEEASKNEEEEEDPEEEEENLEEKVPASPLPMDVDADEDYLLYLEELQCYPEYFTIHSGHASVRGSPEGSSDRNSDSHGTPSYDLSGVWPSPSSCPSL
ncbi:hypothetical protein PIB30_070943, partial [Stylosanthes scabra]|nr:hypothetical protein [Stylosanthes scabra]